MERAGHDRYLPGLDGIRAIAVASVVAYHLKVPFFDGGLLGVSVFFTLSGYLITSLLMQGFAERGAIDLKTFWIRRARRLLPALVFMMPVVAVTTAIARPDKLTATLRQVGCALLYVANWTTIARGDDYFQRFTGPGPLDHLWSLAIEEQFYIVWPLVVFGLLWAAKRFGRGRGLLMVATVLLTAASTWAIFHLYDPHSLNNTRAYEGTDARAASLLVGAFAAMVIPFTFFGERVGTVSGRARWGLEALGVAGLVGVALCIARTDEYSPFLYRGGEIVLAVSTAALAVAASHPATLVARALGVLPMRWIGARSYGVYLWHLPVVAFMPASALDGWPIARGVVQTALIVVLAAASYRLIEEPIRRRAKAPRLRAMVLMPIATLALVIWPLSCRPPTELEALAAEPVATGMVMAAAVPEVKDPGAELTSCKDVMHVGDSTSLGLVSRVLLPNVDDQIAARYHAVGVERFWPEISGARSMVETYRDQPNATQVVRQRRASGYAGCFVMALGTNDPANTSGNVAMLSARIDAMMALVGPDLPAMWTTTKTLKDRGPYQNAHMLGWNQAVTQACARHPKMRVYDWASEVKDDWFTSDGIHFNTAGYRERALRIARALTKAFPKDGTPSSQCVVRSEP